MTKNEITQKLLASGQFQKTHCAKDYKFPLDKDIVLIPVRTQEQLGLCEKLGLDFFEKEIKSPRGYVHHILMVASDFETIAKAIAAKKD
jgi:hypothetical protein